MVLASLLKVIACKCVGFLSEFSVPINMYVLPVSEPHSFDYCNFFDYCSFKVRQYQFSSLFYFKITILGPLHFHTNIKISLSTCVKKKKKSSWDFAWDCVEIIHQFEVRWETHLGLLETNLVLEMIVLSSWSALSSR